MTVRVPSRFLESPKPQPKKERRVPARRPTRIGMRTEPMQVITVFAFVRFVGGHVMHVLGRLRDQPTTV